MLVGTPQNKIPTCEPPPAPAAAPAPPPPTDTELLAGIESTVVALVADADAVYSLVTAEQSDAVPEEEVLKRRRKERLRVAEFLTRQLLALDELELGSDSPERVISALVISLFLSCGQRPISYQMHSRLVVF
jgi:hypothetical protein